MRYLIHFFDVHDVLRRSEAVDCRDDAEAAAMAAARAHPHILEVWQGDRRVRREDRREAYDLAS